MEQSVMRFFPSMLVGIVQVVFGYLFVFRNEKMVMFSLRCNSFIVLLKNKKIDKKSFIYKAHKIGFYIGGYIVLVYGTLQIIANLIDKIFFH